jgi:hypothetical protein
MLEMNASGSLEKNLHSMGKLFHSVRTLYRLTVSPAHGGAGLGTGTGEENRRGA